MNKFLLYSIVLCQGKLRYEVWWWGNKNSHESGWEWEGYERQRVLFLGCSRVYLENSSPIRYLFPTYFGFDIPASKPFNSNFFTNHPPSTIHPLFIIIPISNLQTSVSNQISNFYLKIRNSGFEQIRTLHSLTNLKSPTFLISFHENKLGSWDGASELGENSGSGRSKCEKCEFVGSLDVRRGISIHSLYLY